MTAPTTAAGCVRGETGLKLPAREGIKALLFSLLFSHSVFMCSRHLDEVSWNKGGCLAFQGTSIKRRS